MKLLFISLGCDKNLVDSEEMLGMLAADGHQIVDDEDEAEVIIINTCCFIGDAKEESIQNILEMAELKKSGQIKALLVCGCLAQRYREEIQKEIPEVDWEPWQPTKLWRHWNRQWQETPAAIWENWTPCLWRMADG